MTTATWWYSVAAGSTDDVTRRIAQVERLGRQGNGKVRKGLDGKRKIFLSTEKGCAQSL